MLIVFGGLPGTGLGARLLFVEVVCSDEALAAILGQANARPAAR